MLSLRDKGSVFLAVGKDSSSGCLNSVGGKWRALVQGVKCVHGPKSGIKRSGRTSASLTRIVYSGLRLDSANSSVSCSLLSVGRWLLLQGLDDALKERLNTERHRTVEFSDGS